MLAGLPNACPPELASLYVRARICQTFPAYKLSDLDDDKPAGDILKAMDLLGLANQMQQAPAR